MVCSVGFLFADTWTEDFDTNNYWSGGTAGSYNAKGYTNPDAPGGLTFSSNLAVKETTFSEGNVYSGESAWRISNTSRAPVGEKHFLAEISTTVNSFSVQMAKWREDPNVDIEYSTDGGTTFTLIEAIDGRYFTEGKVYKLYTHTFASPIEPSPGLTIQIRFNTVSGERMLYDDFTVDYGEGGVTPIPLTANFIADITSGELPLTVSFTNLVTGGEAPYLYSWDFNGDGVEDSEDANPTFTYNAVGDYPVKLYVVDSGTSDGTEYKAGYISVTSSGAEFYYTGITATEGEALKSQLTSLISTNTNTSYNGVREFIYSHLDNIDNTVTCVYTGKLETHSYGNTSAPTGMNTEHTYPQSWYENHLPSGGIALAKADAYHLFPTLASVNTSRGNLAFDNVETVTYTYSEAVGYTSYRGTNSDGITVFEPADQHKGNVARAMLYMNLRYNLPLSEDSFYIDVNMIPTLIAWHLTDPVDEIELMRNDEIHTYQGNRNPFVDHPEWVTTIYGGVQVFTCATPTISPAGGIFATPQTITIATTTPDADIYYTIDGTTPTSASLVYTTPFILYDDVTVKAIATKSGFEDSEVASANFVIDIEVPVGMFISEYIEGSSNNKAIEIYNGTDAEVDLTPYIVRLSSNGGDWGNTCNITGTLAAGEVFVIANASANPVILAVADTTNTVTYFNGDDAVGLFYNETLIDAVGIANLTPAVKWNVAGVTNATENHTLVRKSSVIVGNTDWTASAGTSEEDSEWIVYPIDTFNFLGYHGIDVVTAPVISPSGGSYIDEVEVTITSPTMGATIHYTVDDSEPTTASPVYTTPFILTADATVKAMAVKEGYTNSAIVSVEYFIVPSTEIPTGVFISEYLEGSSNNKALEIYNGTGAEVDLTPYIVKLCSNGNPWSATCNLEGTLAAGEVFVIAHAQAGPSIQAVADTLHSVVNFNGDDAIGLFYGDVLIDQIGVYQERPTTGWDVAGISKATADHTLVRKLSVAEGTTDWVLSAGTNAEDSQWIVYPINTFAMLGSHTAPLAVVATPVISPNGGTHTGQAVVSITSTTPIANIYYTIDNSTPTEASQLYTAPFILEESATVKAIALKEGFVPSAMTSATFTIEIAYEDGINVSETALSFTTEVGVESVIQTYTIFAQGIELAQVEISGDFQMKDPDGNWTNEFFFETNDEEVTIEVKFNGTNSGTVYGEIVHTVLEPGGYDDVIIELTGNATEVLPVPIYDLQYTTVAGADGTYPSLYNGQQVLVEGIVTATNFSGGNYFISSPEGGAWNGIYVYDNISNPALGDLVRFKAIVDEFYGFTELKTVTEFTVLSQNNPLPAPVVITTAELASNEAYESVLVTVEGVTVTALPDQFGQWYITDGSGDAQVDDNIFKLIPDPAIGDTFASITGVVDYGFNEFGLNPRSLADFVIDGEVDLATPVVTSISKTAVGIVITWDPVPNATHYKIYGCDTPNGEFVLITTVGTTTYTNDGAEKMMLFKIKATTDAPVAKK